MGFSTVTQYPSMSDAVKHVKSFGDPGDWNLLKGAYQGYDGRDHPHVRAAYFADYFKKNDRAVRRSPITSADVHAYISTLCHIIWLEEHAGLPWSIKNYSQQEMQMLTERRAKLSHWTSRGTGLPGTCWGQAFSNGTRDPFADTWYQVFPLSACLVNRAADHEGAAQVLVEWMMQNFFHYYSSLGEAWSETIYERLYKRKSSDHATIEEYFNERALGCHAASKILIALLRSINIPAIELHYDGHGLCYLPSIGRYVHGDYIADFTVLKDSRQMLMPRSELEKWLFSAHGYMSFGDALFNQDPYSRIKLRRTGRHLYVGGGAAPKTPGERESLPFYDAEPDRSFLWDRLPEYGLHGKDGFLHSGTVPIWHPWQAASCQRFDPSTIRVAGSAGSWKIVGDGLPDYEVRDRATADRIFAILRHYGFDSHCHVGASRADASMEYLLHAGTAPSGSMPGEDCVGFDPSNLRIVRSVRTWTLQEGDHMIIDFPSHREALKGWMAILRYGFSQQCFVGRPSPPMVYFRT